MSSCLLTVQPEDVVAFWREAGRGRWFRTDDAFDRQFRDRFLLAHEAAKGGQLGAWTHEPNGALALLILLDQFPRNAFRGTSRMFDSDEKAREVAGYAVRMGFHKAFDADLRNFFYLPFMHSEQLKDQDVGVELARELGGAALEHARAHRGIIERFGRFPHRNAVLGRVTTPAEQRFLDDGGFAG
jgi:uncharacterized protein (DUF924 family)